MTVLKRCTNIMTQGGLQAIALLIRWGMCVNLTCAATGCALFSCTADTWANMTYRLARRPAGQHCLQACLFPACITCALHASNNTVLHVNSVVHENGTTRVDVTSAGDTGQLAVMLQ